MSTGKVGFSIAAAVCCLVAATANASTPVSIAYLQCLHPVVLGYDVPMQQAGNLANEGLVIEESLAAAGVPQPLVEAHAGGVKVHTYAASEAEQERLDQLIRRELVRRYPAWRPQPPHQKRLAQLPDYAPATLAVIRSRMSSAGVKEWQCGMEARNRVWVSVHGEDPQAIKWVWERRGLLEVWLPPKGEGVSIQMPGPEVKDWAPSATTAVLGYAHGRPTHPQFVVRRSLLLMDNEEPLRDVSVRDRDGVADVVTALPPRTQAHMAAVITKVPFDRPLVYLRDGAVIATPHVNEAIGPSLRIEAHLRGLVGRTMAAQLAACLRSGALPTLVEEVPLDYARVEVPDSALRFIGKLCPGCRLLSYDDYGPGMWRNFGRLQELYGREYLPFAVRGDFDGDGTADWALLVKCGDKVKLVALHHAGATWRPHLVSEFAYANGFQGGAPGFNIYLEPVRKGMARGDFALGRSVQASRGAFEEVFADKTAWLWVWNGKDYVRYVTGD